MVDPDMATTASQSRRAKLSPRETQVVEMTARGLTNAQIAKNLKISVYGIKFHLSSIYRKLGVANRTEAAVAYLGLMGREAP